MTFSPTTTRSFGQTTRRATARTPIAVYFAVWKQRRELASLDENRLMDLGITRAQAATEARRPVWDLPRNHGH